MFRKLDGDIIKNHIIFFVNNASLNNVVGERYEKIWDISFFVDIA